MDEEQEVTPQREFIFNLTIGIFGVVVSGILIYILSEISRINGVVAERGERITRIEGRNDRQDDEIKRLADRQNAIENNQRDIYDYLTGRKK